MSKKVTKFTSRTCPYVIFFGIVVIFALTLQCFIPFLQLMARLYGNGNWTWFLNIFNNQFTLPMELISNFWAAISATYVGLDRAAFAVDAFRNGTNNEAFDERKMAQLKQVIRIGFGIFIYATVLNTFFDANFALAPLFASFGASILSYVAGNKLVKGAEEVCPDDVAKQADICERMSEVMDATDDQIKSLNIILGAMKKGVPLNIKIYDNSKIKSIHKTSD